jgi:glycosyltransferase involved in cell wall biosynthesis
VIQAVLRQRSPGRRIEVVVVDDGSTDDTVRLARAAGAKVVEMRAPGERGNAAAARNRGAAVSRGDPIVFLDADCVPAEGWLHAILNAHANSATVVGGSLALPLGLSATARCDYYCGWYLIHPKATAGWVPHHPPPNLSVRRAPFLATQGFATEAPFDFSNEERFWEAELIARGHRIYFNPQAVALHFNHPGFRNMLRRHYRWGYTAVEVKSTTGAARMAWMYKHPWLLILASPVLAVGHTLFIISCWLKAGFFEPIWMLPAVFVSRLSYVAGMSVGALRWLRTRNSPSQLPRQRPRWE